MSNLAPTWQPLNIRRGTINANPYTDENQSNVHSMINQLKELQERVLSLEEIVSNLTRTNNIRFIHKGGDNHGNMGQE